MPYKIESFGTEKYFFSDYRMMKGEMLLTEVRNNTDVMLREYKGKKINLFLDVTDAVIDTKALEAFKESGKRVAEIVPKAAAIGVTGLKKIFAEAVARFSGLDVKYFAAKEEAIDWLMDNKK